jgi:hypothetical protein
VCATSAFILDFLVNTLIASFSKLLLLFLLCIMPPAQAADAVRLSQVPAGSLGLHAQQLVEGEAALGEDGEVSAELERAEAGSAEPTGPALGDEGSGEKKPGAIWMFMDEDVIRGPFTDQQVIKLIENQEIGPSTPMRLGERPWVQASQVAAFKSLFSSAGASPAKHAKGASAAVEDEPERSPVGSIGAPLINAAPYPVRSGAGPSLGIFAAIAVTVSTALCFDFLIGLVFNLAAWILLYGYLWTFLCDNPGNPDAPPPAWNFGALKHLFTEGAQVFAILLVFGLVPSGLALVGVIIGFLNGMGVLGYIATVLMFLLFMGSMFVLPGALLNFAAGAGLTDALHPLKLIDAVKSRGQNYLPLGVLSVAAGLVCALGVIAAVFLTEIPDFGFVIAGIVLGIALTYAHFVWFRGMKSFSPHSHLREAPAPAEA